MAIELAEDHLITGIDCSSVIEEEAFSNRRAFDGF